MTRYLLDTNIISEVRKPKPHGGVLAWIEGLRDDQLYISAVTIGELQRGIERTRSQDKSKALAIESWLDELESTYNVLPMDAACFREWARVMEGKADHLLEDAMIAATARVHALKVATRNENDFALFRVDLVNPFKLHS
ncbi:MAG: type II toxin-antitoxin system VapC family toxin [Candidatus Acidiferrales bacterium]